MPEDLVVFALVCCYKLQFSSAPPPHSSSSFFVPVTGMFLEHFKITPFRSRWLVHGGTANVKGLQCSSSFKDKVKVH